MYDLNHIYKVGNLISKLREEKGIFQKDLADKFHITRATIASYETGKSLPSLEIVVKYADYFILSRGDYCLESHYRSS